MPYKNPACLYVAVLSDIHLIHSQTPTELIVKNLKKLLPFNAQSAKLDLIWIPGDLFDKLSSIANPDSVHVVKWWTQLLTFCKKNDILLRVLEGTGSHDYKQNAMLMAINDSEYINADVKYHSVVTIEHIDRFDMDVLYIPDEVHPSGSVVWGMVQEKLKEHGLEKVDFAIMHGLFEFQLPSHVVDESVHLSHRYLSIVRKTIYIGHHHTHRVFDRIVVPGSFDRLAHGNEEAKGMIYAKYYKNSTDIQFHENQGAKVYKSLRLHDKTLDQALESLDELVNYPPGSAFRILAKQTDEISTAMPTVRSRFPQFIWTSEFERDGAVDKRLKEIEFNYNPININRDNIVSLVSERLANDEMTEYALELLKGVA